MDPTIAAAIIGAVGSILAALITVLVVARRHSPTPPINPAELDTKVPRALPPATGAVADTAESGRHAAHAVGGPTGMNFDEVIQAIRRQFPDAPLGRTAEQGQYFERAKRLSNYQLHSADPPTFTALQPNGKIMWLYLGRNGKICCGDKE